MNPQQTINEVTAALRPAAFSAELPPALTYNSSTNYKLPVTRNIRTKNY